MNQILHVFLNEIKLYVYWSNIILILSLSNSLSVVYVTIDFIIYILSYIYERNRKISSKNKNKQLIKTISSFNLLQSITHGFHSYISNCGKRFNCLIATVYYRHVISNKIETA